MNAEAIVRGAALGAGAATSYINITMPYLGVPLNVVVAAALGVLAGMAWDERELTRKQQSKMAVGLMFVACATTALITFVAPHWHWSVDARAMAPLALVIAAFGPKWMPAVNDRIGPWLDKIPFFGKKGG